jgi:hypothetical protein
MATTTSDSIFHAASRKRDSRAFASLKSFWRDFFARAFRPYRPELHYMRGPGPAWRAKYGDAAAFRLKSRDV